MKIGEVLKGTRTRQGVDIRTAEERTKIRTKYLRALEDEAWELLPGPPYVRGFLHTYAHFLGLDADALVDEYRRQVEVRPGSTYGVGDEALEHHPGPGGQSDGPGLGIVLVFAVAAGAVLVLVLGLTGDGEGDRDRAERRQAREERRQERRQERRRERRQREREATGGSVTLHLVADAAIHVCLVGDGERPLIDGQVLAAGTEERFEAERFRLAFPSGYDVDQFRLFLNGNRRNLPETVGPAAYTIRGQGRVRPARPPGPGCP